jgi:hypothetical protein
LKPIIFETYRGLESIPWIDLGEFPTPIQKLEKLGEVEGFKNLYVKRDDKSSPIYGGNKVRKLEWVLADAKEKGRKTLMTVGGSGSNQVLATTIYGRDLGFRVVGFVFDQPNAEYVRRNLLLDHHYGTELARAVNVSMPWYITTGKFTSMIGNINTFMRKVDPSVPVVKPRPEELIMLENYIGKCYAAFTPECVSTIKKAKSLKDSYSTQLIPRRHYSEV